MTLSTTHFVQSGPVSDEFKDGYAEVNGQRLHYVTSGKSGAPLMLFIHGAPNFSYYWEDQLAEFGIDHFAVAPDMRGYNLSSRPQDIEQYQLKYLVEDVRQLAGKLNGGKKFILVGHNWGGLIKASCEIPLRLRIGRDSRWRDNATLLLRYILTCCIILLWLLKQSSSPTTTSPIRASYISFGAQSIAGLSWSKTLLSGLNKFCVRLLRRRAVI
jgi:hypothetical protein